MSNVLSYLIALAIVDIFIPLPILALILIYVVVKKPGWFSDLYREIYGPGA